MADTHKCIIGLISCYADGDLVTLDDLKKHIDGKIEFNAFLESDPIYRVRPDLRATVYTLKDYADRRKNTDLTRFTYCPDCGKRIDWKAIKEGTEHV